MLICRKTWPQEGKVQVFSLYIYGENLKNLLVKNNWPDLKITSGQSLYQDCSNHSDMGAQWLSGRVLDSRQKGRRFEPHRHHCVVSLSKNINPSLVLVQPRKTRPYITERLLMGCKESNQTNKHSDMSKPWLSGGRVSFSYTYTCIGKNLIVRNYYSGQI